MPRNHDTTRCKTCDQVIATVTSTGLVPQEMPNKSQMCETCKPFQGKYEAMTAADAAYASFSDRRDTYGPKVEAMIASKQAHMDLENWLIQVDAPFRDQAGIQFVLEVSKTEPHADQQGSKRPKSPKSPGPEVGASTSPTTHEAALSKRKRIKFSEGVEFRNDYRPSEQYSRSDTAYERGRHAAPEGSQYLDTSGSSKSFLKFLGVRKVGKDWIDVWRDEDEEGLEKERKGKLSKVTKPAFGKGSPDLAEDLRSLHSPGISERSQRLSRRRSRVSEIDPGSSVQNPNTSSSPETTIHVLEADLQPSSTKEVTTAARDIDRKDPLRDTHEEVASNSIEGDQWLKFSGRGKPCDEKGLGGIGIRVTNTQACEDPAAPSSTLAKRTMVDLPPEGPVEVERPMARVIAVDQAGDRVPESLSGPFTATTR